MNVLEAPPQIITAEEFAAMPESRTHELMNGELIPMVPVGAGHGDLAVQISIKLGSFVDREQLGVVRAETGFILRRNPDVVRSPDVSFVAGESRGGQRRGYIEGVPTLAVEIVSPGETFSEVEEKVQLYLRSGTREVWVVDEDMAEIHVRTTDQQHLVFSRSEVLENRELLPGFRLILSELFVD